MQVKLFTDICKCYREYEGSCREAAGFVTGYKPVMSNAITQAALQVLPLRPSSLVKGHEDL